MKFTAVLSVYGDRWITPHTVKVFLLSIASTLLDDHIVFSDYLMFQTK